MATTRRNFFKVLAGGLGYLALSAIIPHRPTFAQMAIKPKGKHPPDVLCGSQDVITCEDFAPQITIQDYVPGEEFPVQALDKVKRECKFCMYKGNCAQDGVKFVGTDGKFVPEIWNKRVLKKWYTKSFPENL